MARLIFGVRPVVEALRRHREELRKLWVERARSQVEPIAGVLEDLRGARTAIKFVDGQELERLAASRSHQGIVAELEGEPYVSLDELLDESQSIPTKPLLLVADGVTDPQNLGAMIRAAVVLGATGVVLTKDRCAPLSPVVSRVSSGATEHVTCARVTNLNRALERLKEAGVWVSGTVEAGGVAPWQVDLTGPVALVLGREDRGVRSLVQRHCDYLITIPAPGPIGALNVASATTAVFYEAARQRCGRG